MTQLLADALRALSVAVAAVAAAVEAEQTASPAAHGAEWITRDTIGRFGMTWRAARAAVRSGELPASRAGRRLAIRAADLETYLAARVVRPRSEPDSTPQPASHSSIRERIQAELRAGKLRAIPGGKAKK